MKIYNVAEVKWILLYNIFHDEHILQEFLSRELKGFLLLLRCQTSLELSASSALLPYQVVSYNMGESLDTFLDVGV